ncbi:MAG: uroporphyrinogen decarboxylase family protein [Candidatus Helarchaeota archaeon]
MNSRELTITAIKGVPECIPFNPFIMHLAASLIDVRYSEHYCRDPAVLAKAQIQCARKFGIDHVNVSTDAFREASAWGVEIDFTGHTPIAKPKTYLNWREFLSLETPDLQEAPRILERIEAVRLLRTNAPDLCVIGWIEAPFAELCSLFEMTEVFKIWLQQDWKAIFTRLLERILPVQYEFAKLQIEAGADIIGAGDSAISQIGPRWYKLTSLKPTRELFYRIQKKVPVLYHTCGDNSRVDSEGNDMLRLICSTGASILDIDYQVDMKLAKEKVGEHLCIRGNTDTRLLASSIFSIDKISGAIIKTIQAGKPGGRYMYAAGCEWPWDPLPLATTSLALAKKLTEKLGTY